MELENWDSWKKWPSLEKNFFFFTVPLPVIYLEWLVSYICVYIFLLSTFIYIIKCGIYKLRKLMTVWSVDVLNNTIQIIIRMVKLNYEQIKQPNVSNF